MALDEATVAFLAAAAAADPTPLSQMTVAQARAFGGTLGGAEPGPPMADVRDLRIAVGGGSIPIRIFVPHADRRGVLVHYHGGGWVVGGLDEADAFARHLAHDNRCVVISVGYRLAPEYRYPTAVEDAWSALEWAGAHGEEIVGRPVPLIVAGESAGGNLAAVVARRARDRGGPPLGLQVLTYPVADADLDAVSYLDADNQLLLDRDAMRWFWDHYAPDHASRSHPDASPLQEVDLLGLPPAVVITPEHDVLRDEGELYAMRLLHAGVPVRHRRFAGQMHGFVNIPSLPASAEALAYIADAIDECVASYG